MHLKIMLAITALAVAIGIGWAVTGQTPEKGDEGKVSYVNEKISELTSSADFKAGSIQERKDLAQAALSQLEEENYISELFYEEEQALFSFQYADGTLGGVSLQDFSQGDGPPMN